MTGHWQELDHTADLAIKVCGTNLEELFAASAQGLCSLAFEPGSLQAQGHFDIKLSASDCESLLIDWLNELLYLSEKHNVTFLEFNFHSISHTELDASVGATCISLTKQIIKAATFHNIEITQQRNTLNTEIVFDI